MNEADKMVRYPLKLKALLFGEGVGLISDILQKRSQLQRPLILAYRTFVSQSGRQCSSTPTTIWCLRF